MCQVLEVSRSGYYDWKDRLPSKRKLENQEILKIARKSYKECHGMCGLDKLLADVREKFPNCSRKRLYEIQRKNKLYAKRKKKFKVTTNSNHKLPVTENLLNQNCECQLKSEPPCSLRECKNICVNPSDGKIKPNGGFCLWKRKSERDVEKDYRKVGYRSLSRLMILRARMT
ncbi:MAG: hypothetical protein ACOX0E_03290 [Syntrophomonadaceae bacterium]